MIAVAAPLLALVLGVESPEGSTEGMSSWMSFESPPIALATTFGAIFRLP